MRIAHLLRPAQGGMLRQVRSLLLDPAVETLLAAPPQELAALGEALREPGYPLPASETLRVQIAAGIALGRWGRRVGATVFHGHGLKRLPLYVIAAKRAQLPLVVTLHNLVPNQHSRLLSLLLRQAFRVIAVSHAVARTAPVPATVIHNGIDLTPFTVLPSRHQARSQLDWPQDELVVLSVARLSPEKGLETLIKAAQGLNLRVVIAGEGPEHAPLAARGGAHLLGARDDIPLLLAAADLYCQPSVTEGLGLAIIEAMAAGLPVVASDIGGIPELIPDSETGILVPVGDSAALRQALSRLSKDPQQRVALGQRARERALACFSEEQMRQQTRELYKI